MFFKRFRQPKPTTDADYVAAYKATGNLELLGELYERYMDLVYAVCLKYLRNEEESKDAVMQLFEQLILDVRKYEITHFKSWLYATTRNYCLMQLRQHRAALQASDLSSGLEDGPAELPLVVWPDATTELPDLEQRLGQLDDCLKTLSNEQRTSLSLFYLDQKSYADIVSLTGYDPKQVKSYIQNGRRNLKICLDKRHE